MANLDQLFEEIRQELGMELLATELVGMDGISIAGASHDKKMGTEGAARFAKIMKLAAEIAEKLKLGEVEDNLVTTDSAYFLTRFIGDGSYYWGVAVSREATLGAVNMVMNEYADQLWKAIPR